MKVIPMSFNTEMVKVLLEGHKTVTRRPLKIEPEWHFDQIGKITSSHPKKGTWGAFVRKGVGTDFPQVDLIKAPCWIGDLIWLRETFATLHCGSYEEVSPHHDIGCQEVRYKASERPAIANEPDCEVRGYKWRPSIHMPRHCSRLTLKVTDVRIEQVRDLRKNDEQITREGFQNFPQFKHVWQSIYGQCLSSDYVWVIEFEVMNMNVDTALLTLAKDV